MSELEIKKLVSHANVLSVGKSDENIVEQALIARRKGDGKISLQQIYDTLLHLQNTGAQYPFCDAYMQEPVF